MSRRKQRGTKKTTTGYNYKNYKQKKIRAD